MSAEIELSREENDRLMELEEEVNVQIESIIILLFEDELMCAFIMVFLIG